MIPLIELMKIKGNSRMPSRTKENIAHFQDAIEQLPKKHREKARDFADSIGPLGLFEVMHGIRRWYSGQTMARKILSHREDLMSAMDLDPSDAIGLYRGFKVPTDSRLAGSEEGDEVSLPVSRNHGFSSWSISEEATNRFSGGGKGKVGLIVKLIDEKNVVPVLAPPERSEAWFNALYTAAIGKAYRQTEGEYLIKGSPLTVEIVRVKK